MTKGHVAAGRIELRVYTPEWPTRFQELGLRLRGALGPVARRIDHIGSTAVPELAAKAIIDVQISVETLEPEGVFMVPITDLGFVFRSANPDRTKRYFREAPGERRTHIHVRRFGSWSEQFALLFRDYLRAEPSDRERYEKAKRELASRYRENRARYTDGKRVILYQIMERANHWSQDVGWTPGPSDA